MNLISVQSSNIAQIGFEINRMNSMNAKPINVLRIVFVNGGIFDYYNVEKKDYEKAPLDWQNYYFQSAFHLYFSCTRISRESFRPFRLFLHKTSRIGTFLISRS